MTQINTSDIETGSTAAHPRPTSAPWHWRFCAPAPAAVGPLESGAADPVLPLAQSH